MVVLPLALIGVLSLAATPASAAEGCPNAKYRTGPSLFLPECRAYELVTPQGKTNVLKAVVNGGEGAPMAKITPDGEGILYTAATGPLSDEASAGTSTWERARRSATGWKAESATPPVLGPYIEVANGNPKWVIPSANLDKIFFTASAILSPDQPYNGLVVTNGGVHVSDGITDTWVSQPTWEGAAPAQGSNDAKWTRFMPLGGSPDLSTVYFNSFATLTPADGTSGRAALQSFAVYKFENGELSNAGVLPDGKLSPGGSVSADRVGQTAANSPAATDSDATLDNSVSRDGKGLLFLSPDPARAAVDPSLPKPQLYMAVDGKPSVLISAPEGDDEPVTGTVGVAPTSDRMAANIPTSAYAVATPDHSVVLFSTKDALTEDAEAVGPEIVKTYRYETATGALTYLPDLDKTVITGANGNEKYGQILELSESGDSMLYRTEGNLLRLWRKDKPTLTVATGVGGARTSETYILSARFSADEEVLALNSTGPLSGESNHTPGAGLAIRAQVYRYTVAGEHLECISCKPGGSLTGAVLSVWGPDNGYSKAGDALSGNWSTRSMTADGSTIYFTTKTPLVEADHNAVNDVYQWHDGQLRLISTGASGADNALLYETTRGGRDVFILSAERLSPADTDDFYDIYDVRVDGGFDQPQVAEVCSADACQGPPAPAPAAASMGSASLNGPGSGHAGRRSHSRSTALRASAPKSVQGTTATLRVQAPGAGRLVVTGRLVKKTARAVPKGGAYRVKVTLTGTGKRKLRQGASLKAGLRISFKPRSGATARRTLRVTFEQPGAKGSRAANSGKGR